MLEKVISFFKEHRLLTHLLLMFVLALVLLLILIPVLDKYTNHGEEVIVPDIKGFTVEEAMPILGGKTLSCQIIDSIYSQNIRPGIITEQIPHAGSSVKGNKDIYVIINSYSPRRIAYPEVTDISFRQATSIIESLGFPTPEIKYVPSKYKDLVVSSKCGEREVFPGDRYPVTTKFTLCVGEGLNRAAKDTLSVELNY